MDKSRGLALGGEGGPDPRVDNHWRASSAGPFALRIPGLIGNLAQARLDLLRITQGRSYDGQTASGFRAVRDQM